MTHYYRRDRVHTAPRQQSTAHSQQSTARIDCDTCPIAGRGCGGCMVALLGPVRLRLDEIEQRAVDDLVRAGLASPEEARGAYAVPDLPDWVRETWPRDVERGERLRATG